MGSLLPASCLYMLCTITQARGACQQLCLVRQSCQYMHASCICPGEGRVLHLCTVVWHRSVFATSCHRHAREYVHQMSAPRCSSIAGCLHSLRLPFRLWTDHMQSLSQHGQTATASAGLFILSLSNKSFCCGCSISHSSRILQAWLRPAAILCRCKVQQGLCSCAAWAASSSFSLS